MVSFKWRCQNWKDRGSALLIPTQSIIQMSIRDTVIQSLPDGTGCCTRFCVNSFRENKQTSVSVCPRWHCASSWWEGLPLAAQQDFCKPLLDSSFHSLYRVVTVVLALMIVVDTRGRSRQRKEEMGAQKSTWWVAYAMLAHQYPYGHVHELLSVQFAILHSYMPQHPRTWPYAIGLARWSTLLRPCMTAHNARAHTQ